MNNEQTDYFKETKNLFHLYWQKLKEKQPALIKQKDDDFAIELLTRFSQLNYLLAKVKLLEEESESNRLHAIAAPGFKYDGYEFLFQIQLYTESFYQFAHRILKIIEYYPGLKKLKVAGIVNVRNNLIEHPHGKDGITTFSFGSGGPDGPVIKAGRFINELDVSVDKGMYANAEELRTAINLTIKAGFERLGHIGTR